MVIGVKNLTIKRTIKTEIIVEEIIVVEITDETTIREKEITITEILVKEITIIVEENNHNVKKKMIVISDDLSFIELFKKLKNFLINFFTF